jgi:hypothetical protein
MNVKIQKEMKMPYTGIPPRPLEYTLKDYHQAPAKGPLNFTWQDKPHRLLYDLIAAVAYKDAEIAALKDDAERYRFLEDQCRTGTYRGIISREAIDDAREVINKVI